MIKDRIRADMLKARRAVLPSERTRASACVCARLLELNLADPVSVYLASPDEIDIGAYVGDCVRRGVRIVAPRWNGVTYDIAEINAWWPNGMTAGPHGISEPPEYAPPVSSADVATWLVPGLAFTSDGLRLGYGGGWYDRLMAGVGPGVRKIGIGYRFQVLRDLPFEAHDIRLDRILTD